MTDLLIVGSVAFDTLHNHLGTFPRVLGGAASFAALAASNFTKPSIVGVVGDDYPSSALDMFKSRGINTSGLEQRAGKTFHWEGRYSNDLSSRETIKTELNVFENYLPTIPESLRAPKYLLLGNIAPALQLHVLHQVQRPKLVVADTMNLWIGIALDELREVIRQVDLLVINEDEARELTGEHNHTAAATKLRAMGPQRVVIKLGEYGALLFTNDAVFMAPAFPMVDVADPTGAGDSFVGALIAWLAKHDATDGDQLRKAVLCGSATASFCVSRVSVDGLTSLSADDVLSRMRALQELVRC